MPEKISADDIDIERAATDPDYRRQVLGILNAMSAEDAPPKTDRDAPAAKAKKVRGKG